MQIVCIVLIKLEEPWVSSLHRLSGVLAGLLKSSFGWYDLGIVYG